MDAGLCPVAGCAPRLESFYLAQYLTLPKIMAGWAMNQRTPKSESRI